MPFNRRRFLQGLTVGTTLAFPALQRASAQGTQARIVIIGGGFGGATAAKYLRMWGENLEVILIERQQSFISCPLSNLVIGGSRTLKDLTMKYDTLRSKHGVQVIQAEVASIDTQRQTVSFAGGQLDYDRLILSPGIDFRYDTIQGLSDPAGREAIPHAWKAGPQTITLRKQLEKMPKGGKFLLSIPKMPFRCPPGPYERACQVAFYLRYSNPGSRIIILDANADIVVKKELFLQAWEEKYPGIIEYLPNHEVTAVDVQSRTAKTAFGDFKADVLNIIPPQRAASIARTAGVANVGDRWCEVDFLSYESTVRKNIHVIGDAVSANLPKSGHMANAQAKVCAAAIVALTNREKLVGGPVFANTCYSYVTASEAMHVSNVYRYNSDTRQMQSVQGGELSERPSKLEAYYARAWAMNIWSDTLL